MTSDDSSAAAVPHAHDHASASVGARDPAAAALAELAAAHGVATEYVGSDDRRVVVPAATVRTVLGLLGVDTADPVAALARSRDEPWRRMVPPASVRRRSAPEPVLLRVACGSRPTVDIDLESGGRVELADVGDPVERRTVDGVAREAIPLRLPADLPLGDHTLRARAGTETGQGAVVVVPDRVPTIPPPAADGSPARAWGWMVQLYALTSARSWAMGDYADLAELAAWSGSPAGGRADVLLVNPVHAQALELPVQPSPYSPASRRFVSPLYLRPEQTPEYLAASPRVRAQVDAIARSLPAAGAGDLLDRDAVWTAKRAALELLFAESGREPAGSDAALTDFATWCALAERHGADWRRWPAPLRDPTSPAVAAARAELAGRVAFHRWLQLRCSEALTAAQAAARGAGMTVGILHDLAVGVDPGGADAWAMQDVFAGGASVGAPPDSFNQQGQNWGLPPWRPDRLAESGYAPFREMVAAVLGRGGGLRVDHVLGLFRLWWIPAGRDAGEGTYVRYDADAMLGLLALEANRAGALVVGEDLGTVADSVAGTLADTGVLGSSVLWFERDADGVPTAPSTWREPVVATLTTHDLPTATGYLLGEHVGVRAKLGVLGRSEAAERAAWRADRDGLLRLLVDEGLVQRRLAEAVWSGGVVADDGLAGDALAAGDREALVLGLHRLLVASPARIVLAAVADAFGDRRQPNLPGTVDSYPNWRLPVVDAEGRPVTVERLVGDPAVGRLAAVLAAVRRSGA